MTNEEKEAARAAEHAEFNARYEALCQEAESLGNLTDYYFKPDADIERKSSKLRDYVVSEAAYKNLTGQPV